jgi:DNA-binding MarR family transcriptional regulator
MEQNAFLELAHEIRVLLGIATRLSREALESRLTEHRIDLTGLQYGILRTLADEELTLSELSKRMILDPSTLVPVIDSLERKGYALRTKDPHDRRRTPVVLTDDGKEVLAQVAHLALEDRIMDSLRRMPDAHTEKLRDLLREMIQLMPDGDRIVDGVRENIRRWHRRQTTI